MLGGDGFDGQLGYGNLKNIGDNETPASAGTVNIGTGRTALAVTAGGSGHTCAILDTGAAEDGGVFTFGGVTFHGSLGATPPPNPITAIAARR